MVTAAELIEVPDLRFVEPSFAELTDELYSSISPDLEVTDGRLLVDEEENPIAIALRDDDAWHAATFLYRTPSVIWLERFEETGGEIYQEPRETWARAVRAYYADRIRAEVLPATNDLPPDRFAKARDLVAEHWGARAGRPCDRRLLRVRGWGRRAPIPRDGAALVRQRRGPDRAGTRRGTAPPRGGLLDRRDLRDRLHRAGSARARPDDGAVLPRAQRRALEGARPAARSRSRTRP